MTHAHPADRAVPPFAFPKLRSAIAVFAVIATVAVAALAPLALRVPAPDAIRIDPVVIEAGRDWELMSRQQSGWVDPVILAGRDWERQRKQQSGYDL